jgi:hypothetical protein
LTWWEFLLTASAAFTLGWAACGWQCSRRRDCPLYSAYKLSKWKRDLEESRERTSRDHPEPPGGRAA